MKGKEESSTARNSNIKISKEDGSIRRRWELSMDGKDNERLAKSRRVLSINSERFGE